MSFKNSIISKLNQPIDNENLDYYTFATARALNEYMKECETLLSEPFIIIQGTTIVPGSPPTTVPIVGTYGYFVSNHLRFSNEEVKAAMWKVGPENTFKNLFNLFGNRFAKNFMILKAEPIINVMTGTVSLNTTNFGRYAELMLLEARSIGSNMTPEKFAEIEGKYLELAIKSIIPIPVGIIGNGLIPVGTFSGTAQVEFSRFSTEI